MAWTQPSPVTSKEHYEYPLKIAAADVIRAQKRAVAEKVRGEEEGRVV